MQIREEIIAKIKEVLAELGIEVDEINLEHPTDEINGDYSTNVAMVAAKKLGKNPKDLAEEIVVHLRNSGSLSDLIQKIETAGGGFINFYLSEANLGKELELALKMGEQYGSSKAGIGKTMVIDYSAPNIAKRFGIGHLRSTIVGQAIYNLYKFLGWKVIGDNHLGDWGTQFGVLLYQVTKQNIDPKDLNIDLLEKLYVEFHLAAKEDEDLIVEARKWFKKLEDGDKKAHQLWEVMKNISLEEFNRIYKLLGVEIDYAYGESFYQDKMQEVVIEAQEKGFAKMSEGALIFEFPNEELSPAILKKSDEATTYFTRDLATVKYRFDTWNPERIVYEVGDEQALHFKQVFKAVELLGWGKLDQFVHVNHGLYLGTDGKKMRTRSGDSVRLEEVLDEAIKRAGVIASKAKQSLEIATLLEASRDDIAVSVGIGAIKYFDLSHHHQSNIIFDWEKVFHLEGNSAPYLQYAFARTQSILHKSVAGGLLSVSEKDKPETENRKLESVNPEELAILRHIYKFPEVVSDAAESYSPNLLCNFLFELSSRYGTFYNKHKIISSDKEDFRLALTCATGNILKTGLDLLGIEAPERM